MKEKDESMRNEWNTQQQQKQGALWLTNTSTSIHCDWECRWDRFNRLQ